MDAPVFDMLIRSLNFQMWLKSQLLPELVAHGLHVSFKLAFVLWTKDTAGINETAIILSSLTVGTIEAWIIDIRFQCGCFEIVNDNPVTNTIKIVEHMDMRHHETELILVIDMLDEFMQAMQ